MQGGERSTARLGGRELTLLCGFHQYTLLQNRDNTGLLGTLVYYSLKLGGGGGLPLLPPCGAPLLPPCPPVEPPPPAPLPPCGAPLPPDVYRLLSVIKARFSCILVNFTCRFEDSPSVPERSYEQSVDILGYYYASISHVSTNYPLNFYTLSIDNSFMKVLKNAKSEMPTMFHSILPSKLPMGRMLLQCPNTSMKG